MKIRNTLLIVFTVVGLTLSVAMGRAWAQTGNEPTGFRNVQLWVYPEYDDPRLLVMLQGKIVGANAPARVRFLVPAAAEMYSAGSMDAQGKYTGGPPDRTASQVPGWDEISYELKTDTFRVEYYDPVIATQPDKKIAYDFRWLYPMSDLRVIIQQPRNSTGFTVTPPGNTPTVADGFPALLYEYTNPANPPLHFDIAYTRSDSRPSITGGSATSPQPSSAAPSTDSSTVLSIIVTVSLLIVGVFIWLFRSSKTARRRSKPAAASARVGAPKRSRSKGRFCTQCGQPVGSEARFCPHCGAKLRGSD